ncbi:GTP-binding protein [Escherichia coli]
MSIDKSYCGFIAIVGSPNVGKSTLLNKLLGQKSPLPPARRKQLVTALWRSILKARIRRSSDTPGLHMEEKRAINRLMNKAASSSIGDVELVTFRRRHPLDAGR